MTTEYTEYTEVKPDKTPCLTMHCGGWNAAEIDYEKSDREEIAERGERGGEKVAGEDGRKEAQKRAKNEGRLFELRTGADPLILHRRDWNAAEIDSESVTGKRLPKEGEEEGKRWPEGMAAKRRKKGQKMKAGFEF